VQGASNRNILRKPKPSPNVLNKGLGALNTEAAILVTLSLCGFYLS
jgi:hypothetical protein